MFRCPKDESALARQESRDTMGNDARGGVYWACPACGGRTASMGMLRRTAERGVVDQLWAAVQASTTEGTRRCPACERPMRAVTMDVRGTGGAGLALDVCPRCYFVWFDASEFDALPPAARRQGAEDKLPLEARLMLAKAEVEALDRRPHFELPPSDPPEGWKMLPAFFGLPVKQESSARARQPIATWGISAAVATCSLMAFVDLGRFVQDFGVIPWRAWRYGGLTLLTSFFLHGSAAHLAVSLYFLMAFGDDVEDYLGRTRFLLLLALATVAGGALHSLPYAASSTPLIGAGGGISGLLAFYGLQFPRARIGFLLRLPVFWFMRWVNVRAWAGVLIWIVLQAIGALRQSGDLTQVSLFAHLGGAAMGFLFWFFWPASRARPGQKPAAAAR